MNVDGLVKKMALCMFDIQRSKTKFARRFILLDYYILNYLNNKNINLQLTIN